MEQAGGLVKRVFSGLDELFTAPDDVRHTGIPMLDAIGGLRPGEITVVAGLPGCGKTQLATSIAAHALASGTSVLWFALAETAISATERMLCTTACVDRGALRVGALQRQDMSKLTYAAGTLSKAPLYYEDAIELTAAAIHHRACEWRALESGPHALIAIDYLQLLDHANLLPSLLVTAKQTRTSIVLMSQHLANERERIALESIATTVLYLRAELSLHEITLAKHRHGATPQIERVSFDGTMFSAVENPQTELPL